MAAPRRGQRSYTLIMVPHASDGDVVAVRLPITWLQVGAVLLVSLWIGILIFINAYFDMAGRMEELSHLRAVNRQQREQVARLTEEARRLAGDLEALAELERQVRAAMGEVAPAGEQQPEVRAAVRAGAPAGDDWTMFAAGATAGDPALADLQAVAATLRELRQALPGQREGLERVNAALVEELARRDAVPSIWPVRGLVTSRYGWRWGRFHNGVDIAAPRGTPIMAAAPGRVVFSGWDGAFGNTVIIDHGYGYRTLYAHNSRNAVQVGDQVGRGQVIGYVGSTGRSTGPHVHYEVLVNGRNVNPWDFLPRR